MWAHFSSNKGPVRLLRNEFWRSISFQLVPKKAQTRFTVLFSIYWGFCLDKQKKVESFLGDRALWTVRFFAKVMKLFAFINLLSANFALVCEHEKLRETADDLKRIKHNTGGLKLVSFLFLYKLQARKQTCGMRAVGTGLKETIICVKFQVSYGRLPLEATHKTLMSLNCIFKHTLSYRGFFSTRLNFCANQVL